MSTVHDHAFFDCLSSDNPTPGPPGARFALIILNGEVGSMLKSLWSAASIRICADGGSNRVYDTLDHSIIKSHPPHAVIGDFDSARPEVLDWFRSFQTPVIHVPDQDSTDLGKAMKHLANELTSIEWDHMVIYGGYGGRLDQELGNLHTLHRWTHKYPSKRGILVSEGNLSEILAPGHHVIHCHPKWEAPGLHCGLMVLGAPCRSITMTGLRWNLTNHPMEWGKMCSANNIIDQSLITVECSDPVLWTTEFTHTQ